MNRLIELVSGDVANPGDDDSGYASISADGRHVAFHSFATNLVPGDVDNHADVFVRDRRNGTMERISVGNGGTQGDGDSYHPAISADGRYVAFYSFASNLVPGDTNIMADVFVCDRYDGSIERVSVDATGAESDGWSTYPSISADGRYAAFQSFARNLVPDDTNSWYDIFVYDRQTDTIERITVDDSGSEGNGDSNYPAISADGRYVAFHSFATNLVPGDTNGWPDVFVYGRQTGTIERVSVDDDGTQGDDTSYKPSISADGRYVAFQSWAGNLVAGDGNHEYDVFVRDRQEDTIERVSVGAGGSEGDSDCGYAAISADGRFVAFESNATNLVAGDTNGCTDILVYDRSDATLARVSLDRDGAQGDSGSYYPAISADGRCVAFHSYAANLVPADTNGFPDVFAATVP